MTISAESALIGGLVVAVAGLAGGCLIAWLFRRTENERLERLEDQVEALRRDTIKRFP